MLMLDPNTAITVLASMLGGGGLKIVFDWFKDNRQFNALDKDGLIKELNRIINEERHRCDENMNLLQARINTQQIQLSEHQKQNIDLQKQILQLQLKVELAEARAATP